MTRHKGIATSHKASRGPRPLIVATLLAVGSVGWLAVSTDRADAAEWQQPYGGCAEAWQAPQSAGAEECRAHGWIVRPRFVVGPHGWVQAMRLPDCTTQWQRVCFTDGDRLHPDARDSIKIQRRANGWIKMIYVKG